MNKILASCHIIENRWVLPLTSITGIRLSINYKIKKMTIPYRTILMLGLAILIASCGKENTEITMIEEEEENPIVITCNLNVELKQEGSVLTATVEGGTEPYAYLWSTGEVAERISLTENGEYGLSVTDAEGFFHILSFGLQMKQLRP